MTAFATGVFVALSLAAAAWAAYAVFELMRPVRDLRRAESRLEALANEAARSSEPRTPRMVRKMADILAEVTRLPEGLVTRLARFMSQEWAAWAISEDHRGQLMESESQRKLVVATRLVARSLRQDAPDAAYQALVALCAIPLSASAEMLGERRKAHEDLIKDLRECTEFLNVDTEAYDTAEAEKLVRHWDKPEQVAKLPEIDLPLLVYARSRVLRLSSRSEVVTDENTFRRQRQSVARQVGAAVAAVSLEPFNAGRALAVVSNGNSHEAK